MISPFLHETGLVRQAHQPNSSYLEMCVCSGVSQKERERERENECGLGFRAGGHERCLAEAGPCQRACAWACVAVTVAVAASVSVSVSV
eukprot:3677239-Rhodomonas_salina.2